MLYQTMEVLSLQSFCDKNTCFIIAGCRNFTNVDMKRVTSAKRCQHLVFQAMNNG